MPGSVVFTPPSHPTALNDAYAWWSYVKGASWQHPEGPASNLRGAAITPWFTLPGKMRLHTPVDRQAPSD